MKQSGVEGSVLFPVVLGLFFIWLTYRVYAWPRLFSPYRRLPGPVDNWLPWGHALASFATPPGSKYLEWTKAIPNDGLLVYRSFGKHSLIPTTATTLKAVLNDHAYDWQKPPELTTFLGGILGYGLVLAEGDAHRHQRKQLLPAFHTSVIRKLSPLFWQKGRQLVEKLKGGRCANFSEWSACATLDIIGVAGFAHDFNSLGGQSSDLIDCYKSILEPRPTNLAWFALIRLFPSWMVKILMPSKDRELRTNMWRLRQEALHLVRKRREKPGGADVLSQIIADPAMTDENVVDQILTFLAAGHETTAAALCWVVYLLATHTEAQQRLRDEIRSNIDSLDATISNNDIDALPYLNAVCNETLRMYPVAPVTTRVSVRDTVLGEYPIRKGTTLMLVPWTINRSEQFWSDPGSFQPERWLNGRGPATNYALLTFLHGPRSCIGRDFAQSELRCLVATLVGRYDIQLEMEPGDVQPVGLFTLKPTPLKVRLAAVPGW